MKFRSLTKYLIVKADGDCRVVSKKPAASGHRALGWDEVAYQINLNIPEQWGRVMGTVDITLPEPPEGLQLVESPDEATA